MIDAAQVVRRLWSDEGFKRHGYFDSKGFLTIGPGILIDARREGSGISTEEGIYLLRNRMYRMENLCRSHLLWYSTLDTVRQQVIVCMAYQLGVAGVANFRRMVLAIERRDYVAAAAEMLDSKWAREDSPERAKRMANMMERGEWIEPAQPLKGA